MRALDSRGHPGGAARVKDGRKALRGVVQPRRQFPAGHPLRQRQDVECLQVAELALPPRQNDYRLCVAEHVGHQGVGQRGIQEHHCAASLENAQVRGHDLPIVLRHGHGHDLVGSCEESRKGCGDALCSSVEFSEAQGGSSQVWGICNAVRCGNFSAERLKTSVSHPDPVLMEYVHEVAVANIAELTAEVAGDSSSC